MLGLQRSHYQSLFLALLLVSGIKLTIGRENEELYKYKGSIATSRDIGKRSLKLVSYSLVGDCYGYLS
jgi:hypothetical protein